MAPSEPAHAIVKYRKQTPDGGHFCTGYSTIYQAKRNGNKEKSIIYQLLSEILLSIMKCLDAPSLYVARQSCSLMWSFYYDFSFKSFHYVLKDREGNIVPGALPGFIHYALYGHKSDIVERLRSDQLRPRHHVSLFSEASRLLRIRHTIKVATLTKEQVVTMDLLRQSLERIPTDDLLCPHVRSPQEILMFSEDDAAVGMFMASKASHGVRCAGCDIHYDWVLDEDKVLLSVKRPVLYVLCAAVSVYWRMLRDVCDWIFRWIWSCVMGLSKCLE
ncbi:hypothetical protein CKAH01_06140 [Colletotrichum kahawae]|uniref:Uncharacterized protein n=1 Tax=Colletotrichum kahawae TaxID=34407 RepID=A0AAD9YB66_COLKA|nr:hypothetical protein CKAH01_06140 [Colletotrichum kahawae]